MQVIVEPAGDVGVATLVTDQLDAGNADDFKLEMAPIVKEYPNLVLDLGRVQFVDSRGCGVILSCLKNVSTAGGDLKLCRVTRPVRTIFELIRLHRICEIFDTREQAVQSFRAGRKS
jgi:anti-sigma B factor antagonist